MQEQFITDKAGQKSIRYFIDTGIRSVARRC